MKHKFVIPIMLILWISVGCSPTISPEPLANEGRIATSVAETVAAQTNQALEPTHTAAPASATPLPALTATPTQNLTVLPTATQIPTVLPTATTAVTEAPALLAVGDTIYFEPFAMTLVSANVGNSFEGRHWIQKDGSRKRAQAREGYTYVYFDLEYIVTNFDPETAFAIDIATKVKDKDGDTYSCMPAGPPDPTYRAPGYGGYIQRYCEAPLTAISSLDQVQLEVNLVRPIKVQKATYTFELDKQTQNPVDVSAEKEHEKHFPMDQPFTVTCGTQYQVEYTFTNPRWSASDPVVTGWGFEQLFVDLVMTNPGKTDALPIGFVHALFFDGIDKTEPLLDHFPTEERIYDFPIPGGTGMYRLHFILPRKEVVPLIAPWPQLYDLYGQRTRFEEGCELKIGDYVISDNPDYFVYEIPTTGS